MKIEELSLTKEILKSIKKLDDDFYGEDEFQMEYYTKRFTHKNKGIFLKSANDEIVGYLLVVPIKKEYFKSLVNGVITNDLYVNPEMYLDRSNYYYFNSIVIAKGYQNKGYGSKLMKLVSKDIKKGVALIVSKAGYKLFKKFLIEHLKIDNKTYIFLTK